MKEELITTVYQRQLIWDPRHCDHKDGSVIQKLWMEISSELENNDINGLKSKWRGIRDYYVKELKKIPKPRSGDSSHVISRSNWPYFRQLLYLNDTLLTRDRVTNIVSTPGQHVSKDDAHYSSEKYPSDTMNGRTTQHDNVLDESQLERNESPGPSQMVPQNDDDDEEGTLNMQKEKITNSKQVLQFSVCSSNERTRTEKWKLDDCRQELITLE
ncbi:uncharacterized protein [Palaemon carinicauda]|uniref:uncharacterized protein n=1 Tax=Palaemon carinicauda TaxID=392227 RepID=UPI0035B5AA30